RAADGSEPATDPGRLGPAGGGRSCSRCGGMMMDGRARGQWRGVRRAGAALVMLSVLGLLSALADAVAAQEPGRRVGLIGLDTSHSPAFVNAFNAAEADAALHGYRVVAAYPYGSRTIESSYS